MQICPQRNQDRSRIDPSRPVTTVAFHHGVPNNHKHGYEVRSREPVDDRRYCTKPSQQQRKQRIRAAPDHEPMECRKTYQEHENRAGNNSSQTSCVMRSRKEHIR